MQQMKLCKPGTPIDIAIDPKTLEILAYIALELGVPVEELAREALERGLSMHADKINKDSQI